MGGDDEEIEEPEAVQAGETPVEEEPEEKDEVLEARIEENRQKELAIPKTFNWPNRAPTRAHFGFRRLLSPCPVFLRPMRRRCRMWV